MIAGNSTIVNQPSLFYPPQKSGFHEDLLRDNVERQYSSLFISVSKVYKYMSVYVSIPSLFGPEHTEYMHIICVSIHILYSFENILKLNIRHLYKNSV